MASPVDICNLALSHLGDTAVVSSIDPPDGSAQALHCSRYYLTAKNALLEMACWGFATRRASLAQVTNETTQYAFAYALPSGWLANIAVLVADAPDDSLPQPFLVELNSSGKRVILTNTENAILRYTQIVNDTTHFTPLFVVALSWLLASYLAGPLIKGETGAAEANRCFGMAKMYAGQAAASDANNQSTNVVQTASWIAGR